MFADVVQLYRALGRPGLTNGYEYEFKGELTAETRQLAERCERLDAAFGSVDLSDDGAGRFQVTVQLPTNEQGRVFHGLQELLKQSPMVAFGALPANFYIADLDYCSLDPDKPAQLAKLEKLTQFIRLLSRLADDKIEFQGTSRVNRLLFILPTDATKVRKTALVEIHVEEPALAFDLNHLSLLEILVSEENERKFHIEERQLIMRSVIAEALAGAEHGSNDLTFLCEHWAEIRRKYLANFQAYIQNFAFDDVKKKIVDSELEYSTKLAGAFGDIAGKLLALPLSFAGIVALDSLKTNAEFYAGCAGLFLASIVLFAVLWNVRYQVKRLQSGHQYVFGPLFSKKETYPTKLRKELIAREKNLARQARFTGWTLCLFLLLALTPMLGAVWKAWYRFPEIAGFVQSTYSFLRGLLH